jgi:hypothetical protein
MSRRILFSVLLLLMAFPGAAFSWNGETAAQILTDASEFAPKKLRGILKKNRDLLPIMTETAFAAAPSPIGAEDATERAVTALKKARTDPENALRSLTEALAYLLYASRPAESEEMLETVAASHSCHQAEFDGIQYIDRIDQRIALTKETLKEEKGAVRLWESGRGDPQRAAEAVARSYHVAMNDAVDLMATLWKQATQDTARTGSKKQRVEHGESEAGALSLPLGYDPIPGLPGYYEGLGSDLANRRLREKGSKSPVPKGLFLLNFKGLKVITKEGQQLKEKWKKDHADPTAEPNAVVDEKDDAPTAPTRLKMDADTSAPRASSIDQEQQHESRPVEHKPLKPKAKRRGVLDQGAIETVMSRHVDGLVRCYETCPGLNDRIGTIAVMFTVKLDGTVGDVEVVENTVGSDALADCVSAEVKRATFPPPDGDVVRIRYPFVFQ